MALRATKCDENSIWKAANPGRSRLFSRLGRLKGGCGHDCQA
jgi:hypothetical protein